MKRSKRYAWLVPLIIGGLVGCQTPSPSTPPTPSKGGLLLPQGGSGLAVTDPGGVSEPLPPTFYPFPIMPSFGGSSLDDKGDRPKWKPDLEPCEGGIEAGWIDQFSSVATDSADLALALSSSSRAVAAVGITNGNFPSQVKVGTVDGFVRLYDHEGNVLWTRQFSPPGGTTMAAAVALDETGVYVAGNVTGAFPPFTSAGLEDIYLRKYDFQGNVLWTQQIGSPGQDLAAQISVDNGVVYVVGQTNDALPGQTFQGGLADALLLAYDTNGTHLWTRQIGTPQVDQGSGVFAENGVIYVSGMTMGTFPGQTHSGGGRYDAFVQAYRPDGTLIWTQQFGWGNDGVNIYFPQLAKWGSSLFLGARIDGIIPGVPQADGYDVLLQQLKTNGELGWTRTIGTPEPEAFTSLKADANGVYVTGYTQGQFPGQQKYALTDAFVAHFNHRGEKFWVYQFGADKDTIAFGVAPYRRSLYLVGTTTGDLPGHQLHGANDGFLINLPLCRVSSSMSP